LGLAVPVLPFDGGLLRLVPLYKHLGSMFSGSVALSSETAWCCDSAKTACLALRRACLAKQSLPQDARLLAATACVHGRLSYLVGTWPDLAARELDKWSAEYMRPLRAVLGLHRPPPPGWPEDPVSTAAVCRQLGVCLPEIALAKARLAFGIKVATRPDSFVTAILRTSGGSRWRDSLARSCALWQLLLPSKLSALPDPMLDLAAWAASWSAAPGEWRSLLRAAVTAASRDPWAAASMLRRVGLLVRSVVEDEPAPDADEFFLRGVRAVVAQQRLPCPASQTGPRSRRAC